MVLEHSPGGKGLNEDEPDGAQDAGVDVGHDGRAFPDGPAI
jgi:hypothetical protein